MLQKLRDNSGNWLVKVLLVGVAVSMAAWGIGDVIRNYVYNKPVAKVGADSISREELFFELKKAISSIQARTKNKFSMDEIRKLGVEKQVLESIINRSAFRQEIKSLGLSISDNSLKNFIHGAPLFQDESGKFSRERFNEVLRKSNLGLNEQGFLNYLKENLLQQQLSLSLTYGTKIPEFYKELLSQALFNEKDIAFIKLSPTLVTSINAPTMQELQNFYQQNKESFKMPEKRSLQVAYINPESLTKDIKVDEKTLLSEYKNRLSSDFTIPEKREIVKYTFQTKAEAELFIAAVKDKKDKKKALTTQKGKETQYGFVSRQDMIDTGAEMAFKLPGHGLTEFIKTAKTYEVYEVQSIEKEIVKPFKDVKSQLEAEFKQKEASTLLIDLKKKIEDLISGGSSLQDIAKELKLQLVNITGLARNEADHKHLEALPASIHNELFETAFKLDKDESSEVIETKQQHAFVIHIKDITPSFVPDFDSVKEKAKSMWIEEKRFQKLYEIAKTMQKEITSFSDLQRIAKEKGLKIEMVNAASRVKSSSNPQILNLVDQSQIGRLMSTTKQKGNIIPAKTPSEGMILAVLKDDKPFNRENQKKELERLNQQLGQMIQQDFEELFVLNAKKHFSVTIDPSVTSQVDPDMGE